MNDDRLPPALCDAACLTWVKSIPPRELLRRMGGSPPFQARTLIDLEQALLGEYDPLLRKGVPCGGLAGEVADGWSLLVEPNGFRGSVAGCLSGIAAGTDAVSVFWNVNALAELAVVRNGAVRAVLSDLACLAGEDPEAIRRQLDDTGETESLVEALSGVGEYAWEKAVFPWVESRTGLALPSGAWFASPHPSTIFLLR